MESLPIPSEYCGGYAYSLRSTGFLIVGEKINEVPRVRHFVRFDREAEQRQFEAASKMLDDAPIGAVYIYITEDDGERQSYTRTVYEKKSDGWHTLSIFGDW